MTDKGPDASFDNAPQRPAAVSARTARLLVLGAVLLWSSGGLFAKATTFDTWPLANRGVLLAFWRALFAGLLLAPLVRRPCWSWRLLPMALAFVSMNVTYLTAMTQSTAANAIWLQSTAPFWVLVIGSLVLGEPVDRRDLPPLWFGILGVAVILYHELAADTVLGVTCGLAAGISYAVVILSLRRLRGENGAWLVVVNNFSTALVLSPYVLAHQIWPTAGQTAVLAAFGGIQIGLPYWLFARGLRGISGQEAAGISLIEPVVLPLWVYLAWGEAPSVWTIVGGALILAGLVWRYASFKEDADKGPSAMERSEKSDPG